MKIPSLILVFCISAFGCNRQQCTEEQAYDKLLALGRIQARFAAASGGVGAASAAALGLETAPISELIAQKKLTEACMMADDLAKRLGANLEKEKEGMVTYGDLTKDGGKSKGSGECSIADAAQKQMMVHSKIQLQVDAGKLDSEVFKSFGQDLAKMGELMSTDPSAFCKKLDELEKKYLGG